MMKKFVIMLIVLSQASLFLGAQEPVRERGEDDIKGRLSAAYEVKIAKGLRLNLEEEFRVDNRFSSFDELHSSLGLEKKLGGDFKAGMEYTFIYNPKGNTHRGSLQGTYSIKRGDWNLSLRQRFLCDHLMKDINLYQQPRNQFQARTRAKIAYKIPHSVFSPYLSAEPRLTLNGSRYYGLTADTMKYDDVFFNRVRMQAGVEWKLDSRSELDFSIMVDCQYDRKVDAKKDGTLKDITYRNSYPIHFCLAYSFK